MADLADSGDVAIVWPGFDLAAQGEAASGLLGFASTLIRSRFPRIDDRIAAGTLDASIPRLVAASMVARVLRNPDGLRQESIDDYSYALDQALATGHLAITPEEASLLGIRRSVVGSVPLRLHTR